MSYDVRVPESLLLAHLPSWVKMIWISIRSFQGRGDACYAKYEMIGERTIGESGKPTDKGQVSRAVSTLIDAGFLERITGRSLRCIEPIKVDEESTKVDQESTFSSSAKVDQESTKVDQESTKVDQESTPSKNQHRKPKVKTNKRVKTVFEPDSWQYQFSEAHLNALKRLDVAPASALKDEPQTIQKGAAIFDRLHRLKGFEVDEISRVMRWLLTADNWWIQSGNYQSFTKLLKSKDDQLYFERFRIQSREPNGTTRREKARPAKDAGEVAAVYEIALAAAEEFNQANDGIDHGDAAGGSWSRNGSTG